MPNYVTTVLTADKEVLDSLAGENGEVDFSSVIPMPENIFRGYLGEKEMIEHRENNWYDWSVNNWGTKWNAKSLSGEPRIDDTVVRFETAWAHPFPVIDALSQKFPDKLLHVAFADEDLGQNIGEYTIQGTSVWKHLIEEGSGEARDFAAELIHGMTYEEWRNWNA